MLQSMILTDQKGTGHMVLTPNYHVFEMYKGFQEATYLPLDVQCTTKMARGDSHAKDGREISMLYSSAAKKADGSIILSLSNVSLTEPQEVEITLEGAQAKAVSGRILTCDNVADYNDFENPDRIRPVNFKDAKLKKGVLTVKVPARSIVVLDVK